MHDGDGYQGVTFCQIFYKDRASKIPPSNIKVGAKPLFWLVGGQSTFFATN
jgi:hypothetical protein